MDEGTGPTEEGVCVMSRSGLPASFPSAPLGGDTGFEESTADVVHVAWIGQSELSISLGTVIGSRVPCSLSWTNQSEGQAFGWESHRKLSFLLDVTVEVPGAAESYFAPMRPVNLGRGLTAVGE